MSYKSVIVLIATHNGIQWVEEQIESIRNQEGVDVSILASDDSSVDGTFQYLKSAKDLMILEDRGPFGSAGLNFFNLLLNADFTGFEFVAFSDQDDIWHPWKLARALKYLDKKNCEGYSANVTAFWDNGRDILIDKSQPQREWDFLFQSAGPGCTYVISRALAESIQSVLKKYSEKVKIISLHDWFVYAWARSNGYEWFIDKMPVMKYRQHRNNEFGVNSGLKVAWKRLSKIKSGWYRGQVEAISQVCGLQSQEVVQKVLRKDFVGRTSLALNSMKFRRRFRDSLLLAFSSLMGWF